MKFRVHNQLIFSSSNLGSLIRKYKFEVFSITFWSVYVLFRLAPSSFSLALQLLGAKNDGLLFGSPRPIKSDEWTTVTPDIIARTTNPNVNSFYNIYSNILDDPLPHKNLRVIFQPFSWGFLAEPALGYSIYFTASFLIGILFWPATLRQLGLRRNISLIGGLSIMFSPFVIGWYTHRPGIYGLLPLLLYVIFKKMKFPLLKLFISFWIGVVYLEHTFYPPETILSLHFAIIVIVFRRNFKKNLTNYLPALIGYILAGIFYIFINWSIWKPYGSTLYPGLRKVESGLLPIESFLTQFLPIGYGQSYVTQFAPSNELESATFASILIIVILTLTHGKKTLSINRKLTVVYLSLIMVSMFQIIPQLDFLGKITLLDRVPANRSLFLSGLLITFIALQQLEHRIQKVTLKRILILVVSLVLLFALPPVFSKIRHGTNLVSEFHRSDVFLIVSIILVAIYLLMSDFKKIEYLKIVVCISLPMWLVSAHWNPVASSRVFFEPIKSPEIAALREIESSSLSGKIAVYGFPGKILNASGFASMTDRLDIPDLETLRSIFPKLKKNEFDLIFNRAAEIRIEPDQFIDKPNLVQANLVTIPISTAQNFASTVSLLNLFQYRNDLLTDVDRVITPNHIDRVNFSDNQCSLVGWVKSKDVGEELQIYYPKMWKPLSAIRTFRPDVLRLVPGAGLYNGIELKFATPDLSSNVDLYVVNQMGIIAKWTLKPCKVGK
jgi:hypothetical protein